MSPDILVCPVLQLKLLWNGSVRCDRNTHSPCGRAMTDSTYRSSVELFERQGGDSEVDARSSLIERGRRSQWTTLHDSRRRRECAGAKPAQLWCEKTLRNDSRIRRYSAVRFGRQPTALSHHGNKLFQMRTPVCRANSCPMKSGRAGARKFVQPDSTASHKRRLRCINHIAECRSQCRFEHLEQNIP